MKIGKIVDIHPNDAYHCDLEFLLGTLWDISELRKVSSDLPDEYLGGHVYYAGNNILEFKSNWTKEHTTTRFSKSDSTIFHAVKFETVE